MRILLCDVASWHLSMRWVLQLRRCSMGTEIDRIFCEDLDEVDSELGVERILLLNGGSDISIK